MTKIRTKDVKAIADYEAAIKSIAKKNPVRLTVHNSHFVVDYAVRDGKKRKTFNVFCLDNVMCYPYKVVESFNSIQVEGHAAAQFYVFENKYWDKSTRPFNLFNIVKSSSLKSASSSRYWELLDEVEMNCEDFDKEQYKKIFKNSASEEAAIKNNESVEKCRKLVEAEKDFYSKRPKTIDAPYVNIGSSVPFGKIGLPSDFVEWYSGTMFCAAMSDSYSVSCREERMCNEEASKIIKEMQWAKEEVMSAMDKFCEEHKEHGGYSSFNEKDLDKWLA